MQVVFLHLIDSLRSVLLSVAIHLMHLHFDGKVEVFHEWLFRGRGLFGLLSTKVSIDLEVLLTCRASKLIQVNTLETLKPWITRLYSISRTLFLQSFVTDDNLVSVSDGLVVLNLLLKFAQSTRSLSLHKFELVADSAHISYCFFRFVKV